MQNSTTVATQDGSLMGGLKKKSAEYKVTVGRDESVYKCESVSVCVCWKDAICTLRFVCVDNEIPSCS